VSAVPEAVQAIKLLSAFGDKTGVKHEGFLVYLGYDLIWKFFEGK
jgi:hypothetical protein